MPKKPTDYTRVVIYKIEHNENKELVYVGSTTEFTKRKYQHKYLCNNEKHKNYNRKVYVMIRANGGFDAFQMLEIKKFPCNDSNEARAEEERCRVELKANLNTIRAFVAETKQEYDKKYREDNKQTIQEKKKEWYDINKDKVLVNHKINRDENRDQIRERDRHWYDANRDTVRERQRIYREANRDKINQNNKIYREKQKSI